MDHTALTRAIDLARRARAALGRVDYERPPLENAQHTGEAAGLLQALIEYLELYARGIVDDLAFVLSGHVSTKGPLLDIGYAKLDETADAIAAALQREHRDALAEVRAILALRVRERSTYPAGVLLARLAPMELESCARAVVEVWTNRMTALAKVS